MKFVLLFLFLSSSAHAFRLSPMVVDFCPAGKCATQTLLLENPGKEKVAVQIEVMKRKIDLEGTEDRTEASADFVVFPEQLTLEPNQKRNVRVTWAGDPAPESELAFRLVASQLPVTLSRPTNRADVNVNLKFVLQYVASLYITPAGAKPDIKIEAAAIKKPGEAEVTLKNHGKTRRLLDGAKIKLISGRNEYQVPENEMKEIRSQNILAGTARKLKVKAPADFKEVKAEIRFE